MCKKVDLKRQIWKEVYCAFVSTQLQPSLGNTTFTEILSFYNPIKELENLQWVKPIKCMGFPDLIAISLNERKRRTGVRTDTNIKKWNVNSNNTLEINVYTVFCL